MPELSPIEKYRAAARKIGSKADYVERLLTGLAAHQRIEAAGYWGIAQPEATETNFSVLTTALSYENIAEWLGLEEGWDPEVKGLDDTKLEKLTRWIFEKQKHGHRTRLGESRNLKLLNQVVAHPAALKAFDTDQRPLQDAARLAAEPAVVFRTALTDAETRLREAHDNLKDVSEPEQFDRVKTAAVAGSATALHEEVERKIAELV